MLSSLDWRRHLSPAKIFLLINLAVIIIVFILGFRPDAFKKPIAAGDLASYNGQKVTFIGRVCEEADVDYKSRRLTVCAQGQVLVTADLYPVYDYGNFIKISGELKTPPEIDGFDYGNYLARYDIYSVMYYPKITLAEGTLSAGQKVFRVFIRFKQSLKSLIDSGLPEPEAGLADAILLGYRRTVDREDLTIFSRVGLSHMIAISGSHITILSAMLINFLLAVGLSRPRALRLIFLFLFLYPLVTGLSASAVRSAIMGGLSFLAVYYGRGSVMTNALMFSGALMLLNNPRLLRDDIGFQLSFLAVLGIIYIYPLISQLYERRLAGPARNNRGRKILKNILDTVNLTLVSQLITLPILLINFQQFSVISPLANVLVIWTFAPLLGALIISLIATAFFPPLAALWFLPDYLLLKFIFIVSGWLAAPSWAAMPFTRGNWYQGAIYYAGLLIAVIFWRCASARKTRAGNNR